MDIKELSMRKVVCPFLLFHSFIDTVATKNKNANSPTHLSTNNIQVNKVILESNNAVAIDRYRKE
ncbi:hypothetical protein AKO1_001282 [Acrasis kona]|uniref:Uncharacterized protein n=1 Tax=Acrasis kona TaxID=1008807 RepID=A0AAW2ZE82_9EUKA